VDEDGAFGMMLVADHLVSLGHQRIACIASPPELMFSQYRLDGLRSRLHALTNPLDPDLVRVGDMTQRSGFEQASLLLELPNPPTAIVAFNDLMAFGAMSAAQNQGLVVGSDIAITGFDNIPMATHSHPPLTTVDQPIYEIGSRTCEMLVKRIRGEILETEQLFLNPQLCIRASSMQAKN
jgi:LacI family transcriptional regulator